MEKSKEKTVLEEIDETIESVCEKIKDTKFAPGEYSNTVAALATLIQARAALKDERAI